MTPSSTPARQSLTISEAQNDRSMSRVERGAGVKAPATGVTPAGIGAKLRTCMVVEGIGTGFVVDERSVVSPAEAKEPDASMTNRVHGATASVLVDVFIRPVHSEWMHPK